MDPAEEARGRDIGALGLGGGEGAADVGALLEEAEGLGEDDLADDVGGGEGDELVEAHGLAALGELVEPAQQQGDGVVDGLLGLQDVAQGVGGRHVPRKLVLDLGVRRGEGVDEATVLEWGWSPSLVLMS